MQTEATTTDGERPLSSTSAADEPGTLKLEHVVRSFGGVRATNDVSLVVPRGQFLSLVGPNGAGKTTLIGLISGFIQPDSGVLSIGGIPYTGLAPERISALGVARTFQTSRVFPGLTIWDSVRVGTQRSLIGGGRRPSRYNALTELGAALFGLPGYHRARSEEDEKAEHVLSLFGDRLWPRRFDAAYSLSYANRRRLDIARAIVAGPHILLLDEPTAGMNPTETLELAELIGGLHSKRSDLTIVLVEHKLNVVRMLSHRTVVMNYGTVIADAEPRDALEDPTVIEAFMGTGRKHQVPIVPAEPSGGERASTPAAHESRTGDLIRMENVNIFYGAVQALFDMSLRVEPGETVAVLGGNASGKSTTIRTVLGLVKPRTGQVFLDGQRIDGRPSPQIIGLGVASIPEGRRMFAEMSVYDNLLLGAYPRRQEGIASLQDELDAVWMMFPWLKERRHQLAGTLSGGEQQMLALARARMRKPRLLCVDEPSMGLSPRLVDEVYDVLARWKSEGLTVLMVEQNANMALDLADRAYVLQNGHLALEGSAADLRKDPAIQKAYLGG